MDGEDKGEEGRKEGRKDGARVKKEGCFRSFSLSFPPAFFSQPGQSRRANEFYRAKVIDLGITTSCVRWLLGVAGAGCRPLCPLSLALTLTLTLSLRSYDVSVESLGPGQTSRSMTPFLIFSLLKVILTGHHGQNGGLEKVPSTN